MIIKHGQTFKFYNNRLIQEQKRRKHFLFNTLAFWYFYLLKSDHYDGISNNWPYGPIYCSPITRKLLLSKYPRLK